MPLSSSISGSSSKFFYGDFSDFEDEFEDTQAVKPPTKQLPSAEQDDVDEGAYQDEPTASGEWVKNTKKGKRQLQSLSHS